MILKKIFGIDFIVTDTDMDCISMFCIAGSLNTKRMIPRQSIDETRNDVNDGKIFAVIGHYDKFMQKAATYQTNQDVVKNSSGGTVNRSTVDHQRNVTKDSCNSPADICGT